MAPFTARHHFRVSSKIVVPSLAGNFSGQRVKNVLLHLSVEHLQNVRDRFERVKCDAVFCVGSE